ncbi:MAG TPA: hypothetical protein VL443_09480 [Cyclobacteriaceae bacterium]|jgi:hypothetical protein|nr:hypothetical protein [Cyclobacteriaceae bacterium]
MRLRLLILILTALTFYSSFGQGLDKLKLTDSEVPEKYKRTDEMLYKSIQAGTFYDQTDLYESFIGKIKNKEFQSYESKDDNGAIYYYEFETDFKQQGFLEGLLWGGKKPTKAHPEEFFVKGNILIIWSFVDKSEIKKISKDKIIVLLR